MGKPAIFICSSSSGLQIANALQSNLYTDFDVEVWNQGAFTLGQNIQGQIKEICRKTDFVIIVLTPDVITKQDGSNSFLPRDNVLFELGLFSGLLGQEKTFIIHENNADLRLPDYISGIICGRFAASSNGNLVAALGPVCQQIRAATLIKNNRKNDGMIDRALKVVCHALTNCLTPDVSKLRAFIFKKDDTRLICCNYWAPYQVNEVVDDLYFEINPETEKQVAVVKAAVKKKVCAVAVSTLPEDIEGVEGEIDPDLCFVVAAPILSPEGKVWGTVDLDASSKETEAILRRDIVHHTLFELGKLLYPLLSGKVGKVHPA